MTTSPSSASSALLRDVRGSPERADVDPIGIELQHGVVEFARRRGRFVQAIEVADILPRFANDARVVRIFRDFVPCDHRFRGKGFELVQRRNPFEPALGRGFPEIEVNAVVDDVALSVCTSDRPLMRTVWWAVRGGGGVQKPGDIDFIGASKIARDIGERREAERLQNLLVGELTHRVKNVLATVNAVVRQTLGPVVPDSQEAVLQARLEALARAYDLLTISNWENASLHGIVRKAMSPYREDSVQIEGDPVFVSARAVLPLSLILHELGTNAAKYGALSVDGGQVFLRWSVANSSETAKPVLKLLWEERGGPAVTVPSRQGFGSRLIKAVTTSELGGCVVADYAHTGFVCDFEIALSSLTDRSLGADHRP
ncbi:sensor histidine kinase [Rhizobium changzhiense]|uniref:histidine kinase n=1 Tax=Rhizobium changzhiense TaxID=2692317 RepID=A0ABR6A1P6_9HYPH|nr:sensor histidine kinase [Rhizobium changzhiense]MBA5800536.1 sensor histidine kinase [Rhizobium changzhiense]